MKGLIIVLMFSNLATSAQCVFNKTYDIGNTVDGMGSTLVLENCETVVPYFQLLPTAKYYILKIDQDGDTIWAKGYEEPGFVNYFYSGINGIIQQENEIITVGRRETFNPEDTVKGQILKFNPEGEMIWKKHYGTHGITQFKTIDLWDNHYYVSGGTNELNGGFSDFNLRKIDTSGVQIWSYDYGGSNDEVLLVGRITFDNSFIMSGGVILGSELAQNYIVKTDLNGEIIWEQTFGSIRENGAFILPLEDGSYFMVGSHNELISGGWQAQSDLYKLDGDGEVEWVKNYNYENGSWSDFAFRTVPILKNENLYAAGIISNTQQTSVEGFLMKLNLQGDSIWLRRYDINPDYPSYIYDLNATPDGGFLLSGTAVGIELPLSQDGWIVKVDSFGCLEPGCHLLDGITEFQIGYKNSMTVFPNPVKNELNIVFDIHQKSNHRNNEIIILDELGREVFRDHIPFIEDQHQVQFGISKLSSGHYTLHWLSEGVWMDSEKLIKD